MGYIKHNAIVVTSWSKDLIEEAHDFATDLQVSVTNIVSADVNSYFSFLIGPDGSKEGWPESDSGDIQRAKFKDWLKTARYEDGSSSLDWVEISYSGDDDEALIVDHEWKDPKPDE